MKKHLFIKVQVLMSTSANVERLFTTVGKLSKSKRT